jgi:hypothetical protein
MAGVNSSDRRVKGEIEYASVPLRVFAAFGEKEHIVDHLTNRGRRGHGEDAGHRQAGAQLDTSEQIIVEVLVRKQAEHGSRMGLSTAREESLP